jgi:TP901 family phage tail tape measure protein
MAKLRLDLQLTGFKQASSKLKQFSSKMKSVGSSLSAISLPLAIAGGAAIKMGADFDKNLTKIKALVGATEKDLQDFSSASKRMAKETGLSSKQTSEAMFFIASAGLEGAEAIAVLEAASKASAAGLGDVAQVADLATSALNAYGSETLSAEAATDVLTAAVREGKLNSEELAGAMGQVLPVASNMGVSFNEVGAAMAAMSRTGTNAAQGATQLNSILSGLLKPTKQAEDALNLMGLSSAGLKQQIKDEGLLSVLETLKTEFDKNSDAAAQVFPNIRALRGVLDLTGKSAETTKEIFNELNNAQGATKKAFEDTADSASFRLTKSLNGVKESFASVGAVLLESLLPIIEKIAGGIENLFTKFTNLDGTTQKIIIGFGLFVTAIGPVLLAVGTLTSVIGTMAGGFATLKIALIAVKGGFAKLTVVMMANPFVAIATAIVALTGYLITMGNKMAPLISKWQTFKNIIKSGGSYSKFAALQLADQAAAQKKLDEETENNIDTIDTQTKSIIKNTEAIIDNNGAKQRSQVGTVNSGLGAKPKGVEAIVGVAKMGKDPATALAESIGNGNILLQSKLTETSQMLSESQMEYLNNAHMFNQQLGGVFESGLEDLASGIGAALGQAIATGGSLGSQLGAVLLGTLGGVATQIGKMAIGIGIALEGIKKALQSLNPFVAIAAGIALVALGSFFQSKSAKISESIGGGGGAKAFAKGGIVSTPTLGLVGEYPGARSNPEVIAPLDKLKSIIGDRGQSQVNVSGQFALRGQDLVVALQRAERNRNRVI